MTYENPVLNERAKSYGDYKDNAWLVQQLKEMLRDGANWHQTPAYVREAFDMVLAKMVRAVNGDYRHRDNIIDAIGYLELALTELDKELKKKD